MLACVSSGKRAKVALWCQSRGTRSQAVQWRGDCQQQCPRVFTNCRGGETAYSLCEREGGKGRRVWHLRFAVELLSRITCAREAEEGGITIVYWFRWQAQVPKRWVSPSIV